ncbi:hypothetical protein L1987_52668 [Smallanthus sonchifolius]|uniref:Uncharacterized protein n=1 Tax=Smallanthus sonchifolius TaxID=185202 RepID=A0ACB9EUI7_9ASTR|nr:hypothetical protein L1987_52668 [Smallanthus sonchifolius]
MRMVMIIYLAIQSVNYNTAAALDKIPVVGTVTGDVWVHEILCIKVTALRFTETARARIEKAGGECSTFD